MSYIIDIVASYVIAVFGINAVYVKRGVETVYVDFRRRLVTLHCSKQPVPASLTHVFLCILLQDIPFEPRPIVKVGSVACL